MSISKIVSHKYSSFFGAILFRRFPKNRNFWTSSTNLKNDDLAFLEAQKRLKALQNDPNPSQLLKLYGLFKQSTLGPVQSERPYVNPVLTAKWDSWFQYKGLDQESAKQVYIQTVNELVEEIGLKKESDIKNEQVDQILSVVDKETGVRTMTLNRPDKYNAISRDMYFQLPKLFKEAAEDLDTKVLILTGSGDFYSSGNDLSNLSTRGFDPVEASKVLAGFIASFIDFPKPLLAAVNGPAIGVTCTTLLLCDAVYCSEKATFSTPFVKIGQSPEGCSSLLFPKVLGHSLANEVLLMDKKLNANEAKSSGMVSEIFSPELLMQEVRSRAEKIANFPPDSMRICKSLIRGWEREKLHEVNRKECEALVERWNSEECQNAMLNFMSRKKK